METQQQPNPFRQLIYEIVCEIIDTKQGAVVPCYAHIGEIRNALNVELMEALRGLCRENLLQYHIDLNKNPMFELTERQ